MKIKLIIELAAMGAAIIFYLVMLLTQKKRRQNTDKKVSSKTRAVWIVIPILLAVSFLVNYSAYFVVLMCALCSLGMYIVCKEDAEQK